MTCPYYLQKKRERYQEQIAAGQVQKPVLNKGDFAKLLPKMSNQDRELVSLGLYVWEGEQNA